MFSKIKRCCSDPRWLLVIIGCLGAFVAQSGELGSADTMHRLQVAHSLWTSEPPVLPQEYPEFGIHGRGGKLYDWYGIGQPLLLLPFDIVATGIERLPIFSDYSGNDPSVRSIIVSYAVNMLLNALTALICVRLLRLFKFTLIEAIVGALALLFCTTHLHYTQNMMENNYIQFLTLVGFTYQYEWLRTGLRRSLLIGCVASGLNLLTRLTTGLDLIAVGTFLMLALLLEGVRRREVWNRFLAYAKIALPTYAAFLLLDRLYQFYRFGSFFNTYVSVFAKEYHQLDPTLPPGWPWTTPFHVGFLGPLITPEKSIFLFDPLLVLTVLVVIRAWKRLTPEIKAYLVATAGLLLAYISFYARYFEWSGNFAWGDRYVSTSAQLMAFISAPLLIRHRDQLGELLWRTGLALIAISGIIQVASLTFWLPLEIYQMETLGHPTFVIALRFKNIVAFALGRMDAWGLTNDAMTEDPWDYVHITTWNFLPFLLRRVGAAPSWVVETAMAVWYAALAGFLVTCWRLQCLVRRSGLRRAAKA
ncbi:MAG TPA: hypothetical protein VMT53_26095 [Terriglobales bacterium]|nr:hypothetical protein [Terriglobales bacterium]